MKIGLFSDPHCGKEELLCRTRRPSLSFEKIKEAMDAFIAEGVDLVICLGDFIDCNGTAEENENCLLKAISPIKNSGLNYIRIPGNHDYAAIEPERFAVLCETPLPPFTVTCCGCDIICLDANYRKDMTRYDTSGFDWKDSNLPSEQLVYLKNALDESTNRCIVAIHENLDPAAGEKHTVRNAAEARKIIYESGKVDLVLQGHYHKGTENIVDGIHYITMPAMCEGESNSYRIIETNSN